MKQQRFATQNNHRLFGLFVMHNKSGLEFWMLVTFEVHEREEDRERGKREVSRLHEQVRMTSHFFPTPNRTRSALLHNRLSCFGPV